MQHQAVLVRGMGEPADQRAGGKGDGMGSGSAGDFLLGLRVTAGACWTLPLALKRDASRGLDGETSSAMRRPAAPTFWTSLTGRE